MLGMQLFNELLQCKHLNNHHQTSKYRLLLVSQLSSSAPPQALLYLLSKCNQVLISIPIVYFFSPFGTDINETVE